MNLAPSPAVVCLGEALIDVVAGPDSVTDHVGGSPLNVACGVAQLGHRTGLAGWWGSDARGRRIDDHLARHGLQIIAGSSGAERTSTAVAQLDAQGQASYQFDLDWQLPPLPTDLDAGHLHTGSIAATLAPGADAVRDAVRRLRATATVSYDPNTRPAIMGSPSTVLPRVEELISMADLVKASDEDAAWLYPGVPVESVAGRWLTAGAGMVVITRGAAGATAWAAGEVDAREIAAKRVRVVDTVGAGDSFMAGLISGLLDAGLLGSLEARRRLRQARWPDVRPALDRAVACAAETVSHCGAYSPRRDELDDG